MKNFLKISNRIRILILVAAGVVVGLLMSHVADAIYGRYLVRIGYFLPMTPDVTEIYETTDFSVIATTSAQGLRNPMVSARKPMGVRRILALGDSFTYGWGVAEDQAWPRVLEHKLRSSGDGVEVINAGVPGIALRRESRICELLADTFDIDIIILGFHGLDDLYQAAKTEETMTQNDHIKESLWPWVSALDRKVIVQNWHNAPSGSIIYSKDVWKRAALAATIEDPDALASLGPDARQLYLSGLISPFYLGVVSGDPLYLVRLLDRSSMDYALGGFERWLKKLKNCADKRDVVFLLIPSATIVTPSVYPYREELGFIVDKQLLTLDLDALLRPIIERVGFAYVSLIQPLRQSSCDTCYFKWDVHFTPLGQEKTAQILMDFLSNRQ